MNNDLASDSTVWRALFGVHWWPLLLLYLCTRRPFVKEPPRMFLRWMTGPPLETGTRFRCCTVGELWRDSDSVSVMAVREKCDEKGLRADTAVSGVGSWERAPSRKAREGAHPQFFSVLSKNKPALYPLVKTGPPAPASPRGAARKTDCPPYCPAPSFSNNPAC